MVEAESGVSQVLSSIRDKLKRGGILKTLSIRGNELSPEEEFIRAIKPTSVARSELTVNPGEVKLLDKRVNEIRSWVLAHGERKELLTDPEEKDLIKVRAKAIGLDLRDLDFSQNSGELVCFEYNAGSYSALADVENLGDNDNALLFLIVGEDKNEMEISFDFQNHFSLEIFFEDPENQDRSLRYNSSVKPLDEMTPEEYRIIQHYLGEYSKEATSSS